MGVSSSKGTLKTRVLKYFGITDIYELLTVLYLPDPPEGTSSDPDKSTSYRAVTREKRLSSLCRLVFSSAFDDGDPLALDVLRICAEYLANQINVLLDPVDVDDAAHKGLPRAVKAKESVICFGGSLVAVEAYRRMVLDDLHRRGHVFKHVEVIQDAAAVGATGLAAAFKKMREHDVTM
jgi:N-acetylglucosamine kinase-like BadF-type ATPase